ncbi:MAG TPA: hydroxyphenylacetyl-CoA thioesterase PaaI [Hyphomicrobiaceae bacterium]|nr:hydroxyphenylacetyl-CoA thioesterase PaaI [Hyphomicrobiaceae bacterium]
MTRDAGDIARLSAAALWADDRVSQGLGMEIVSVGPGRAELAMMVTERMVNGHGFGHGGIIFTLADSALAFASNAYGRRAVAQHCTITYLAPARLGMRLLAVASERHRGERGGIYDVSVRDAAGTVIAEFRGHARTLPDSLLEAAV